MKKILIILFIFSFSVAGLKAQTAGGSAFSLQYSIGFGMGDLKDFIGETSFRGFILEWRKQVSDKVFVGLESGWNVFYEKKGYTSYTEGTLTITGTQYRYVSAVPILVNAGYFFNTDKELSPYAALGVGTMFNRTRVDVGVYQINHQPWHFAVKPELGFLYKPQPGVGILVAAKYYNGFETSDAKGISYIGLNIGVIWMD